jgi:hypothetical protein
VGFGKACEILATHRTVFLDAPPGSGRITTAKMLLWQLRHDAEKFRELLPQEEESTSRLNPDHIGDGDRVWLDLSDVKGPLQSEVCKELASLRRAVQDRIAHLVVVLPHEVRDLSPEFDRYRVSTERPSVREVLHRYLRMAGIGQSGPLPRLRFLEVDRPLREVPEYVRLVTEARAKAADQGDLATWCVTADEAWSGQQKPVAELVARLQEGPQRALLLATAMLHGAHADSVHRASASLLQTVEYRLDTCTTLEHSALDQRLQDIDAELDASDRVRFKELDYDPAVRAYFWTHMPGLRQHIKLWVGKTAASADLSEVEREDLVRRFTEQCLNDRYRSELWPLVEQWTAHPTTGGRIQAAALVLQRGLQDERHGGYFRRQIYHWSCRSNLPADLAEVIIAACRDEMVVRHPDEALVRLHHVARREDRNRARETLVGLVGSDRRFLRQMLNRVTDMSTEGEWPADVDLFLELIDPMALTDLGTRNHALIAESTVRRQLTIGWRRAFAKHSQETWIPRVQQWFRCAAEDERHRHALLDVLIEGGERRTDILARFYGVTRRQELRAIISDLVLQKINTALGVQCA